MCTAQNYLSLGFLGQSESEFFFCYWLITIKKMHRPSKKKANKAMNADGILDGTGSSTSIKPIHLNDTIVRLFFRWLRDYHTSVTVAARLTSQQEGTTNNLIVKGELAVHPSIHSPLTHSFIVNWPAG